VRGGLGATGWSSPAGGVAARSTCRQGGSDDRLEVRMKADLRYAVRMLLKSPVFTGVAVLTLALGIGANTSVFSVVRHVLLKSLPYRDADRLVTIWLHDPEHGFPKDIMSYPRFQETRNLT